MQQSIILCFFILCGLIFGTSALNQPGCGKQNKDFKVADSRIVGGSPTEYMEFPWVVYIKTIDKDNSTKIKKCTGSIIHPKYILTASHCLLNSYGTVIIAGAGHVADPKEKHQVKHKVGDVILHPQLEVLYGYGVINDIALLMLEKPINLGPGSPYKSICLPTDQDTFDERIIAAGYGCAQLKAKKDFPSVLMKIAVERLDKDACKLMYRREEIGYAFTEKIIPPTFNETQVVSKVKEFDEIIDRILTSTTLCTLKTACQGDSGSPAMCIHSKNELYYLCGVASFGSKRFSLTVYANVVHFSKWISDEITSREEKSEKDKL